MSDNDLRIDISFQGKRYVIKPFEFTGLEALLFREKLGFPPMQVFSNKDALDIDSLAGLVWLVRRRSERRLKYETVAGEMTWDLVDFNEDDSESSQDDDAVEVDDPEA